MTETGRPPGQWTYDRVFRARDAARDLLEQLELDAFLFGVEPRRDDWEVRVEYATHRGWKTKTLSVSDARLSASRSDAAERRALLELWREALADAKIARHREP